MTSRIQKATSQTEFRGPFNLINSARNISTNTYLLTCFNKRVACSDVADDEMSSCHSNCALCVGAFDGTDRTWGASNLVAFPRWVTWRPHDRCATNYCESDSFNRFFFILLSALCHTHIMPTISRQNNTVYAVNLAAVQIIYLEKSKSVPSNFKEVYIYLNLDSLSIIFIFILWWTRKSLRQVNKNRTFMCGSRSYCIIRPNHIPFELCCISRQ